MNWSKTGTLLVGFLLIIVGCNDLTAPEENENLLSIDEGIQFSVLETHDQSHSANDPVEPQIVLNMETKDIYNCMNFPIVSDITQASKGRHIEILGVGEQDICLTALGPATKAFPLNIAPGEYDISFTYKKQRSTFQLTVDESSLQITGDEDSFISSDTETFWRYPENSFAFLCQSTQDTRWMCEDFEQMLNEELDIGPFEFSDGGTVPYPTEADDYDIANYYSYPEESVFQQAGEMLEAYSDTVVNQQEGAYLSVINWKNQGFRSWTDTGE